MKEYEITYSTDENKIISGIYVKVVNIDIGYKPQNQQFYAHACEIAITCKVEDVIVTKGLETAIKRHLNNVNKKQ